MTPPVQIAVNDPCYLVGGPGCSGAGPAAVGMMLPHLARQLIALHAQRADTATQVKALMETHPHYQVLTSMPGIGARTAATSVIAETLGRHLRHRSALGLLRRTYARHQTVGVLVPR